MLHEDFEITISPPTEDGYSIRGESSLLGRSEWHRVCPNFEDLNQYIRDIASRDVNEQRLKSCGEALFDLIIPMGPVRDLFHRSLGKAEGKGFGLHICLPLEPPELAALPWEYLHHRDLGWLAASVKTPVVRSPAITVELQEFQVNPPLRLLFLAPESAHLDAGGEAELLKQSLSGLRTAVEIDFLREKVTLDRIADRLTRHTFHVIHFMGHAVFANDESYIDLDDDTCSRRQVRGSEFANLFTNHRRLKLVVLNACEGAHVSGTRPLVGVVPELMRRGVPGVVGMQFRIYDQVALTFAEAFYRTLFQGPTRGRVDLAITEARNHLATKFVAHPKASRALGAPVLFVSVPTGQIYAARAASPWSLFAPAEAELDCVTRQTIEGKRGGQVDAPSRAQAKARLRRRRLARFGASTLVFAITASLLKLVAQGALDYWRVDTNVRTLIASVADGWLSEPSHPDVVLITAQRSREKSDDGREDWVAWRKWHVELIRKLAEADTGVIALDFFFYADQHANDLARAMEEATEVGTDIVVANDHVLNGEPMTSQPVRSAASVLAAALGGKGEHFQAGFCNLAPLWIFEPRSEKGVPTLPLAAHCLHRGLDPEEIQGAVQVDRMSWKLQVTLPGGVEVFDLFEVDIFDPKEDPTETSVMQKGDRLASIAIHFSDRPDDGIVTYAYRDVLNMGSADLRKAFENRIVVVGQELAGDRHTVWTSSGPRTVAGVRIQANVLNALLTRTEIGRVPIGREQLFVLLFGVLGGSLGWLLGPHATWKRMACSAGTVLIYACLTILIYVKLRLLLDAAYPLLAYLLAFWSSALTRRKWYSYTSR
jgi:CHASE2 domain-containing sensor protein